ncbi:MAG: FG-GAP-like repeat-containing protein, partial [Bacteroidia bacterium]
SQSCCDILRIYDGTSASGTLLASISGSLTQNPTVRTATSGSMYITWTSDISQVASGWSSSWTSGTPPPPPPPILGPLPTITSFSPTMGNVGIVDTIVGTNFSTIPADNVVYFGASRAQVLSATTTQLLVNVPLGITHKPISVTRNGLTAFSSKPYSTTFSYTDSIRANSFSSNVTSMFLGSVKANNVADLNNDGKPDFIEATTNTIIIRKNISQQGILSQASFAPPLSIASQSGIVDLKTGDIDGDGWLDIIIYNGSNQAVNVLLNLMSGNGGIFNTSSFSSSAPIYVSGSNDNNVEVADINGDGKVEIIIPSLSYDKVSVVKNISTPGIVAFGVPVEFLTATNPKNIGIADMDNDGKLDIVVSNSGSNSISILKNTSTSTNINFNPRVNFPATSDMNGLRLCDIDNDNKIDLSYISGTNVYVRRNNSAQGIINSTSLSSIVTLAANTTSNITDFEYVEINGDGKLDLVTCYNSGSNYSVWQNNAISGTINASSFGPRIDFLNSNGGQLFTAFDADGDKRNDLIFNNNFASLNFVKNQCRIFAINSMSVSSYVPGAPIQIPFTFTLLANPGNTFTAQLSDSSGSFANPIDIGNMLSTTSGVITGMIPMYIPAGQNYRIRIVSDFPSLTSDESSSPIRIFIPPVITSVVPQKANPGQTIVINGNNFSSVNTENIIHFGTMRGTVLSASSTQLSVLVPNGVTNAAISVSVSSYTAFSPEIFQVAYVGTGNITSTTFGTPTSLTAGSSASYPMNVEMCDVDQDRRPDIVIPRNGPTSPTGSSIFRNLSSNGTIAFGGIVNFVSASTASNSKMIDIDGDGWKDLVTINSGAPTLSINKKVNDVTNIVTNSFLSRIDYTTAGNPSGLTYGDIDRDGKIDLVTANFSANNISIFRNISTIGTIDNTSFATRMDLSTGANTGPISVLL